MKRDTKLRVAHLNWRVLIAVGVALLLLALLMGPGDARPAEATATETEAAAAPAPQGPMQVSMLDLIGKVSLAVLIVYGLSFGLTHFKKLGFGRGLAGVASEDNKRLKLCESLALGKLGPAVHLLEVDGKPVLIGSCAEQLFPLWQATPASEDTDRFRPVKPAPRPAVPERPLFQQGFGQPARAESDWAQQRTQLISSLLSAE